MIYSPPIRWYRLTPDRLVIGLLVVEWLLWLSERFQYFGFNQHKGWTVLIAVASVGVAMLVMLLWLAHQPGVPVAIPVLDSVTTGFSRGRCPAVQLAWRENGAGKARKGSGDRNRQVGWARLV